MNLSLMKMIRTSMNKPSFADFCAFCVSHKATIKRIKKRKRK